MPYLTPNNNTFATSINARIARIRQSADLRAALTKLRNYQNTPNRQRLETLYIAIVFWIQGNPKEFNLVRNGALGELIYEIECKACQLGAMILTASNMFRNATRGSANILWNPLSSLNAAIQSHQATWAIKVTDLPAGGRGVYNHLPEDKYVLQDRAQALTSLPVQKNPQKDRNFWLALGKYVTTPRNGTRYGRCYSCAAAVIYTLVRDQRFDQYMIEHVASVDYDHHLVLVGRPSANGIDDAKLNTEKPQWKWSTIVIDVWQENLNTPPTTNFAALSKDNDYVANSGLKWYCAYTPNNRIADRAFANNLPAVNRVADKPGLVEAARAAARNQGPMTRNVKGADGKWIIEVQQPDGSWARAIPLKS